MDIRHQNKIFTWGKPQFTSKNNPAFLTCWNIKSKNINYQTNSCHLPLIVYSLFSLPSYCGPLDLRETVVRRREKHYKKWESGEQTGVSCILSGRQRSVEWTGQQANSQLMGTSGEQGPGTVLTKGAATDAIISASCRYNEAGRHRAWHWQTCVCVCVDCAGWNTKCV